MIVDFLFDSSIHKTAILNFAKIKIYPKKAIGFSIGTYDSYPYVSNQIEQIQISELRTLRGYRFGYVYNEIWEESYFYFKSNCCV